MAISFSSQFSCSHSSRPPTIQNISTSWAPRASTSTWVLWARCEPCRKHGTTIMWKVKLLVLNGVDQNHVRMPSRACLSLPRPPSQIARVHLFACQYHPIVISSGVINRRRSVTIHHPHPLCHDSLAGLPIIIIIIIIIILLWILVPWCYISCGALGSCILNSSQLLYSFGSTWLQFFYPPSRANCKLQVNQLHSLLTEEWIVCRCSWVGVKKYGKTVS